LQWQREVRLEGYRMNELMAPFIRLWNYVGHVGGFPGQLFFCCVVVLIVLGGLTWLSNRK
jgi:hypothetical protein